MPEIHIDSAPMILFCHFCEIHGPSIVFSTCMTKFYSFDQYNDSFNHLINSKKKSICEGCSLIQKNDDILKTDYSQQSTSSRKLHLASPNPFNGYITYDDDEYFHYITTDEPLCYKSQARHSCVRSLSCETYPGDKEGTIYYGDDYRWHHLSWMFVLQDEQARGFSRTYSIIISQSRKYDLIKNWSKFSQYVYKIINLLKTRSKVTFERESTVSKDTQPNFNRPSNMSSSSSLGYPQKMNTNFMDKVHRSQIDDGSIRPAPFRRTTKEARSLVDLTGDTSIFSYLHENFCLILKLVSQARLELLAVASIYRNNSFKLHNFINHHQASTSRVRQKSGSSQNLKSTNKKYALTLRHLYKFLDKDKFETLTYSLITGGLIVLICDNSNLLLQIILCIIQILPEERASWQIVSQQDIVSSSSQSQSSSKESSSATSSSVLGLEENQPNNPKDSSQNISSTETLTTDVSTHRKSISVESCGHSNNSPIFLKTNSEYNILGFTNSFDFEKKKLAYTVLINILQCDDKASFVQQKQQGRDNLLEVSANYELQKYKVTLHSKLKKTNTCKLPHYQTKLTQALLSLDISDTDFQLYIKNLKQEWSIYARIASSMTMKHDKNHSTIGKPEYQAHRESNLTDASTSSNSSNQQHEFRHQIVNNRPNSGNENVLAQNLYNLLNISDSDMKLFEFWA